MKSLRWSRWGLLSMCCAASAFAQEGEKPADLFGKLDANKDGQLTLEEVPEDARPHFERLIRKGDKDENKSLSLEEFTAAHTPDAQPQPQPGGNPGERGPGQGNPGQFFERLDANKDGKISKSEIPAEAPEQVRAMFNRAFEKAGKEELSREDLMQAVGQAAQQRGGNPGEGGRGPGQMLQMLKQLDKNGDGKVTQDEFPAEGAERLKGLLERLGGGDGIDIQKAEQLAAQMGRGGEGRPDGQRRPEGEGRPDGQRRPDGEGRPPEGAPRVREGGDRVPEGRGPMPFGPPRLPLLDELDENKDGRLSKEEFSKAEKVFAALDQNQDGSLDPRELMGPPPRGPEGGRDMGPEGRGPRPDAQRAPGGDRPAPRGEGDRPAPRGEGDRPRPDGAPDRPAPRGEGDRPAPRGEGDRPRPDGAPDRPAPRGEGDRPRPEGEARNPRPDGDNPRPAAAGERGRAGGGDRRPEGAPAGGRMIGDELWKQLDKNGDGSISKEEAPERMKENFDRIDANKDGKIDREEARAAMERSREAGAGGPARDRRPEGDRPDGERRRPDADQPKPKPEADKPAEEKPADKPADKAAE